MLDDSKYKSPYYGLWLVLLVMIGIPFLFYGILYGLFDDFQNESAAVNEASARALGFSVGTAFHLSFLAGGAFSKHIAAVGRRVVNFFGNLKVSVGFAFQCYFEDIKSDGAVFLIVFAVMAACAYVAYTGLRDFFVLWVH